MLTESAEVPKSTEAIAAGREQVAKAFRQLGTNEQYAEFSASQLSFFSEEPLVVEETPFGKKRIICSVFGRPLCLSFSGHKGEIIYDDGVCQQTLSFSEWLGIQAFTLLQPKDHNADSLEINLGQGNNRGKVVATKKYNTQSILGKEEVDRGSGTVLIEHIPPERSNKGKPYTIFTLD